MISFGFLKQKKWIALILVLLSIGGYYYYSSKSTVRITPVTEKDTVAVSTGTIRNTIQGVGTVTAASTQSLQFNSNGKIVAWNVSAGDAVKKGQILASVDTRDVDNDIAAQELSLKNTQISYDKLFSSTKDYQVTQMQNSIAQTKQSIAIAPKELENLTMERDQKLVDQQTTITNTETNLANAKTKMETLQSDIDYTKASSENTVTQSSTDLVYTLRQADVSAGSELSDAKSFVQTIGTSALHFDTLSIIPIEFSAKNSSYRDVALTKYSLMQSAITNYESYVSGKDFTQTGAVLALLPQQDILSNAVIDACDALSAALTNSMESTNLSAATISSLQSSVSSTRSKFANYLTSSNTTKKSIVSANDPTLVRQNADNTIANKQQSLVEQQSTIRTLEANLASQKVALEKLQSDYEIKIAQKKDTIANLSNTLKANEQNLADMIDGPTSEERASALNQIEQAKISLAKTKKKKEDYQIIASFDGVVTASNGKVGEISTNSNSSSTTATSITVEVTGLYKISVLVDQLDVVKVKNGQNVDISFDSYAGKTFTGVVSEVDPTPTTSQGVVSYTVKILFQSPDDLKLYNNMTSTITIVTESRDNVLLVPTTAISTGTDGKKMVRLWVDGRPKMQEVTTGGTLSDKTEILTGVSLGDKVVATEFKLSTAAGSSGGFSLFGGRKSSSSSSSKSGTSSSSSRGGGDMGGPPPGM